MAAGTITVSLHATLHNVSKIKNEICENNNRVNCEDRNLQQTLTNLPVKQQQQQPPAVSKSMENILTQQQPSSTTNSAADSETTNATRTTKESSKSSSKKRARDGNGGTPELMRCKRRINFAQLGYNIPPAPPTSVARRNERERNRVKLVNMGFATLREHVPNGAKNKKMSKVDTLRSAVEYIRKLQQLLNDEDFDDDDDDDMNDILEEEDEEEENNSRGGESSGRSTMKSDGANSTGSSDVGSPYRDSNADSPQVFTENLPPTSHPLLGQHYHHLQNNHHHNHHHHHPNSISTNNHANNFTRIPNCPPASVSPICSVSSSPSPSQTSDYSSYEPLSPEEEDLLDFTSWFT